MYVQLWLHNAFQVVVWWISLQKCWQRLYLIAHACIWLGAYFPKIDARSAAAMAMASYTNAGNICV